MPVYLTFSELESSAPVDDWEVPREKLRLIRAIGEGAFGVVMEGVIDTGKNVTVGKLPSHSNRFSILVLCRC